MSTAFERLAIPLMGADRSPAGWWVIEAGSNYPSLDPDKCEPQQGKLPQGWKGTPWTATGHPPIQVTDQAGQTIIRLLETRSYEWSIKLSNYPADLEIKSSLEQSRNWKVRQNSSGDFKVINYLGLSDFSIRSDTLQPLELTLEFVSTKFDFDSEYRQLTEDIGAFCQQLLLEWDAPTSLRFSPDAEEPSKLLLEQFLFLRHFMTDDRLSRLLEAIDRNPHSRLVKERSWVPAGAARSSDYLSDPMRLLRDWRKVGNREIPAEVCDISKRDTHDTAPNRFVKFALSQFRHLCAEVCAHKWTENGKASSIGIEAKAMQVKLDALLARRFFNEVGRMQRLPLDNQTLQKREGYREVLQAWLLTQAATSLNWEGEQDCYKGTTRDVATLYEYWIFIKLHELLRSIDGLVPDAKNETTNPDAFISDQNGKLTVNLRRGQRASSRFIWNGPKAALRIDLFYERSFSYNEGATRSGSYSRRFRPDYTLTIYPATYSSESKAEAAGKVAHLHFDAKYRAEDITNVFGETQVSDEDLEKEKLEGKSERTYKRGDLLKMHTYNDALRHTIGSYVLYPGTATSEAAQLNKFHEIAPGVGAMVMKPGNEECLDTIKGFLEDVFEHQSDTFSQYRYLSDTSYQTHSDEPEAVEESDNTYNIARKDAPCVLLWLRQQDEATFRQNGFAYCRAISEAHKQTLDLNLSIEIGSEFIPCGGGQGAPKTGHGWRAKVRSARFISKEKLRAYIEEKELSDRLQPSSVDHYLLFEFDDPTDFKEIDLTDIYRRHRSGSDYMAVTCTWSDILNHPAETEFRLESDS